MTLTIRARLLSILFWSVIVAAFIGPGTVTTSASAGANHGLSLLWALTFSTAACLVLQEASCRITVVSGSNLGQALVRQYGTGRITRFIPALVAVAILLGCAAFQAGNILGAAAGLELVSGLPRGPLALAVGAVASVVLWLGSTRLLVGILGGIVAVLGISFLTAAIALRPAPGAILAGSFVPVLPEGTGLLVLALIGTTVVPYNLFLGSSLSDSQSLAEMRFGLTVAVVLGGIISMGILVVGSATVGDFSYPALAEALAVKLGAGARWLLGVGLFAAGVSSVITAPLAATITARSVFARGASEAWGPRSVRYRAVWGGVLAVGLAFGVAEVQPIPAIILAQAANGVVLPFVAVFLLIAVNDRSLMGLEQVNRGIKNPVMAAVVFVTIVLGVTNVMRALAAGLGVALPSERMLLVAAAAIGVALAVPVALTIRRKRALPPRAASQVTS